MKKNTLSFISKPVFGIIGDIADTYGIEAYVVGGYIRDRFLGRDCKDIDFVVTGDGPQFARSIAKALGTNRISIYRRFGTAMLRYQDLTLEIVGARKESYRKDSRKPVVEQADLQDDIARRDFTINAMAISLNRKNRGKLVDPFNGLHHLNRQLIKTPLDPVKTFYDDPLRIMRAIRFASQLHFKIAANTRTGIQKEAHRLSIISQERITDELIKILQTPKPSIGLSLMEQTGILKVILPEIERLKGVEQIGQHRHKDVFDHTLKVVDNIAAVSHDTRLLLTALFHDIAKPATKAYSPSIGWTFHGHEEVGARMFERLGKQLRLSNDTIDYVTKLIRLHLRPISLSEEGVTDSAIRRLIFKAGKDIDDLITFCRADITSGNPKRVKRHLNNFDRVVKRIQQVEAKDHIREFQPPIRGDEIMRVCGISPGPAVGKIKNAIQEAILNGEIPNDYNAAYQYMLQIKDKYIPGK